VTEDPHIRLIDGQPYIGAELLALLCGITVDEVRAETARQREAADKVDADRMTFRLPKEWRRGAKEVQARLGTDDLGQALAMLRAEAGL
jgi:hypothetical protein